MIFVIFIAWITRILTFPIQKKNLFVRLHYLALTDDFYTFAVIGETITLASPNGQTFLSNGEW